MNYAHAHLVLNHIPVIGIALSFLLLVYGILQRKDDLTKAALAGFVFMALVAVPAYLTGEPAEKVVKGHPGVASAAIEVHEDAAGIAMAGMELLGIVALAVLLFCRRRPVPVRVGFSTLVLALMLTGVMAWTANLGGKIHHTELTGTASAIPSGQPAHESEHED
ncbi:MAG: hypothetical protein ACE14M_03820 [Terriglobales bacterium]